MTNGEEQNFLISVAANDELRLAFRSQLELMRAVSNDKDGIRSAAEVRMRTLAALGLSTLAAESFLEHDLLSRAPKEEPVTSVASTTPIQQVPVQAGSSSFMSFVKSPLMTVLSGLTVGFLAALAIFEGPETQAINPAPKQTISPAVQTPSSDLKFESTPAPLEDRTLTETEVPVAAKQNVNAARKPAGETIDPNSGLQLKANGAQEQPVVDRQNPGAVTIKPKIKKSSEKSSDSTARE